MSIPSSQLWPSEEEMGSNYAKYFVFLKILFLKIYWDSFSPLLFTNEETSLRV